MEDSCSRTHCLNFSDSNNAAVLLAVSMLQMSFQRDGDNFHILMRVSLKTFSGCNFVIIQYAKGTEVDTIGVEVFVKTKSMVTIQPIVLGMSSCICFVYYFFIKSVLSLICLYVL